MASHAPVTGPAETIARQSQRVVCGRLMGDTAYRRVRPGGTTDWLLLVTVAGRGRLRLPGAADVVIWPGQIPVVEPFTPHDYGTDPGAGRWSLRWAHIDPRPEWLPLLDWPSAASGIRQIEVDETTAARVVQALDRATAVQGSGLRRHSLFAANAVEEALLWCDTRNPGQTVFDPRLRAVLEYIGKHPERPHTMTSLARVAGLSPSRLAHLATAQLGTSLMSYVEQQRMELARRLLDLTNLPVTQVAAQVGFCDPLYFSRRFRAATSMSPTGFRTRARAAPHDRH